MDFSDEVIDILEYLGKKFGLAIDWTNDNVIGYLKQLAQKYITYKISLSWLIIIISLIVMLGCLVACLVTRRYKKRLKDKFRCNNNVCIAVYVVAGVVVFITLIPLIYSIYKIIECRTFPEKALFDYVSSLAKWH